MNFLPATLEEGKLRTALGDMPLTDELRAGSSAATRRATCISASGRRTSRTPRWCRPTTSRTASPSAPPSTWSSRWARTSSSTSPWRSRRRRTRRARGARPGLRPGRHRRQRRDRGRPARRRARSREGEDAELWVDARTIHVFDPASGATSAGSARHRQRRLGAGSLAARRLATVRRRAEPRACSGAASRRPGLTGLPARCGAAR